MWCSGREVLLRPFAPPRSSRPARVRSPAEGRPGPRRSVHLAFVATRSRQGHHAARPESPGTRCCIRAANCTGRIVSRPTRRRAPRPPHELIAREHLAPSRTAVDVDEGERRKDARSCSGAAGACVHPPGRAGDTEEKQRRRGARRTAAVPQRSERDMAQTSSSLPWQADGILAAGHDKTAAARRDRRSARATRRIDMPVARPDISRSCVITRSCSRRRHSAKLGCGKVMPRKESAGQAALRTAVCRSGGKRLCSPTACPSSTIAPGRRYEIPSRRRHPRDRPAQIKTSARRLRPAELRPSSRTRHCAARSLYRRRPRILLYRLPIEQLAEHAHIWRPRTAIHGELPRKDSGLGLERRHHTSCTRTSKSSTLPPDATHGMLVAPWPIPRSTPNAKDIYDVESGQGSPADPRMARLGVRVPA